MKHLKNRKVSNGSILRLEFLEERTLLSALPLTSGEYTNPLTSGEYTDLAAKYSTIALPETMDELNVITLDLEEGDGLDNLKSAIETAGKTEQSDLIVVRTSAEANKLTFTAASDKLTVSINAQDYGSLTIVGLGDTPLTIDAAQFSQILTNDSGTELQLANLILTGGQAGTGGALYNVGSLAITDSEISGNTATDAGAIYNSGTLTITNSKVSENIASQNAGAIYSVGTLNILNSEISGNTGNTGGAIYNNGTLNIRNSQIAGNMTRGSGGAVYNSSNSTRTSPTSRLPGIRQAAEAGFTLTKTLPRRSSTRSFPRTMMTTFSGPFPRRAKTISLMQIPCSPRLQGSIPSARR